MKRYKNDPFAVKTRYKGVCGGCSKILPKGCDAYYWPSSRKLYCPGCGEQDYRRFLESARDEEFLNSQFIRY